MAGRPFHALSARGFPPERAASLARALGLPLAAAAEGSGDGAGACPPPPDRRVALLIGEDGIPDDPAEAAALWDPPFAAWVDAGSLSDAALRTAVAAAVAAGADLYANFTTAAANRVHLAGRVVVAIAGHRSLSTAQRDDMELALHEAVSNAVVHGNLQVEGMKGLSVDALDRFSAELANRMADPTFSDRRIVVLAWMEGRSVTVEVADEGAGFAADRPHRPAGAAASGRGLGLIGAIAQSYELLDDGRRIRMRFAL